MKKIGEGSFTKAYLMDDGRVFLDSCDPIKEVMAQGWFPNSNLFPKLKFFNNTIGKYTMRYYPKQKSLKNTLKPSHYAFYKELRGIFQRSFYTEETAVEHMKKIKCPRKRRIMIDAVEACMVFGPDVFFEISPRNVAVSDTGGLVLMDCFLLQSKLTEVSKEFDRLVADRVR